MKKLHKYIYLICHIFLVSVALGDSVKQAIDSTMYNLSYCLNDYNKKFNKVPEDVNFTEKNYREIISGIAKSNVGNYNIHYVYSDRIAINSSTAQTTLIAIASDKSDSAEYLPSDRVPIITYNATNKTFSSYRITYSRLMQYLQKNNNVDFMSNLNTPAIKSISPEHKTQKGNLFTNNRILGPDVGNSSYADQGNQFAKKPLQAEKSTNVLYTAPMFFLILIVFYLVIKVRKPAAKNL